MFVKKEGFLLTLEKGFNPFFPPFYFTQDKKLFWGPLQLRMTTTVQPPLPRKLQYSNPPLLFYKPLGLQRNCFSYSIIENGSVHYTTIHIQLLVIILLCFNKESFFFSCRIVDQQTHCYFNKNTKNSKPLAYLFFSLLFSLFIIIHNNKINIKINLSF